MNISMIAAIGKNNELGKNNGLIWRLPNDLKFFKETTTGKTIVMGRNTFVSLPKMLPNRKHIVISNTGETFNEEVTVCDNMEKAFEEIKKYDEVFIIGGASIYTQFLPYTNKLYLTEINAEDNTADVYFPKFDKEEWQKTILAVNSDDNITYEHVLYERKNKLN
jgi:dihydrofolate reductase